MDVTVTETLYQHTPKVITIDDFGVLNFVSLLKDLKQQDNIFDKKNRGWFDVLPTTFLDYPDWFFLMDGDEFVSFATIQPYYTGCYRVLTRTYTARKYRRFILSPNETPSMFLLDAQLKYLNDFDSVFVTMQGLKRRPAIEGLITRINNHLGQSWQLCDAMLQTCDDPHNPDCWQNVIYNGEQPKLETMTTETYQQTWPNV